MIYVRWRKAGDEQWSEREYPDDMLQTLMDRANKAFGDPEKNLGGPVEALVPVPIRKPGRRKQNQQ